MKKILFVGAGFLQAYIIKAARALGYITYAIDANPDSIGYRYADFFETIDIINIDACLQYAKETKVDGVMTVATDFGVETAACISEELDIPGLTRETVRVIKNKHLVRKALVTANADDSQDSIEISGIAQADDLHNMIKYPVMVKPCDGSGSRGASKAGNIIELKQACKLAIEGSLTSKAVIEPFITGVEYGVETFVYDGAAYVLAVMKKWMTEPPYYAELGHAIPSGLGNRTEDRIKEAARSAINALGITVGAVNMDIIVTDAGTIHIVDIGARMGGNLIGSHVIPTGTGYDYMENIIRAAVGDDVVLPGNETGSPVATKLLALKPGVVKKLPDIAEIEASFGVRIEHHLCIGRNITPYRTNLDGCGYIIATSDSLQSATEKAEQALRVIDSAIVRA